MKDNDTIICKIPGKHDWQELNALVKFETGTEEDWFESEADYLDAIRQGFVEFDGKDTILRSFM